MAFGSVTNRTQISRSEQTVDMEEICIDPDPMTQVSSWLETPRGAGEPMPEAMAVATATTEGRPSSRMVLLRGIDHRGLVFYTDQESGKGQELRANPFAAALFHWFKPVHRQVRVTGAVEVVDASLSDAYWQLRPPGSRRSAVVSHQSQVIASRVALEEEVAKLTEAFPDDLGPPRALLDGAVTGFDLTSSNCGKKEQTGCTIDFATGHSLEVGRSSGCRPELPFPAVVGLRLPQEVGSTSSLNGIGWLLGSPELPG